MRRKIFCLIIIFSTFLNFIIPIINIAAEGDIATNNYITYKVIDEENKQACVYETTNKNITQANILSNINIQGTNYTVTKIAFNAFVNCKNLNKISIPNTVVEIDSYAFQYCESLKNIELPDSIQKLNGAVFCDCTGLESITIPGSISNIPGGLFYRCSNLKEVVLEDGVKSIGDQGRTPPFYMCTSLEKITIPNSVIAVVDNSFRNMNKDAIIYIREDSPRIDAISEMGITYDYETNQIIDKVKLNVTRIPIVSISLKDSDCNVKVTNSKTLNFNFIPEDTTEKNKIIVTSENEEIVSTSIVEYLNEKDYYITGNKIGEAYINITAPNGFVLRKKITVKGTYVKFNENEITLNVGDEYKIDYKLESTEGKTEENMLWSSRNANIATFEKGGIVKAKAVGTTDVYVSWGTYEEVELCKVNVLKPIQELRISEDKVSLKKGDTHKFNLTYLPVDTTDKEALWESSNESVATVSEYGVVTAVGYGKSIISATVKNKRVEAEIRVIPDRGKIEIDSPGLSLNVSYDNNARMLYLQKIENTVNSYEQLEKTENPFDYHFTVTDDGNIIDNTLIDWQIENDEIATIDSKGNLKFTGKPGDTTLYGYVDGQEDRKIKCALSASCELSDIEFVTDENAKFNLGDSGKLEFNNVPQYPSNLYRAKIKYSVIGQNPDSILSIDNEGNYTIKNNVNINQNNVQVTVRVSVTTVSYYYYGEEYTINKDYVFNIKIKDENTLLKGDLNKDGKISLHDAFTALRLVISKVELTDEQIYIIDLSDDGKARLYDAFMILKIVLKG